MTSRITGSLITCNTRIDLLAFQDAVDSLIASRNEGGRAVHLCNAYTLSLARADADYTTCLNRGDLNLPDGKPLAALGKSLGLLDRAEPVRGADLMAATLDQGRPKDVRHFLYGSTPETIEKLTQELLSKYPGINIVGAESPPFRPLTAEERKQLIHRLEEASPDIVWVGLGTPKQDLVVEDLKHDISSTFVAVGAAFDFLAGLKPRAPKALQNAGLEWAYRFASEPRRLWRRYLFGNATFLLGVMKDWRSPHGFRVERD